MNFSAFSRNKLRNAYKVGHAKSDHLLRYVRLSVRSKQLGSHWTDFDEI
jgi:hypothetical protein